MTEISKNHSLAHKVGEGKGEGRAKTTGIATLTSRGPAVNSQPMLLTAVTLSSIPEAGSSGISYKRFELSEALEQLQRLKPKSCPDADCQSKGCDPEFASIP